MELNAINGASTYIIQSQDEEIKRIALELHEGISQNLFSVFTGLEVLQNNMTNPDMASYAQELKDIMSRTIQEVRLLSVELYPTTLTTLGLTAALSSYIKLYTSTFGIIVEIISNGKEKTISEGKSMALFRSCQEALINIAKYADTANAKIVFTWNQDSLTIEIEDIGKGFNIEAVTAGNSCKGIAAMKERMFIAGGNFQLFSTIGKGTKVIFTLPISC
ncbi:sensor histidine kinase [Aquibacillus kalidii]|uniref:sensor histidine kinase n=1 Tax=Aquibacillus kalidii TaxID=2762597 RepID=UPI0016471375|nr:histidine kinase [Aquibacillus kalidii]